MMKFGYIDSIDANLCRARVRFPEDEIVSHWLPMLVMSSQGDTSFYIPAVGSHVVCMMDERLELGVILGAIYDSSNTAGGTSGSAVIEFASGAVVRHQAGVITVSSGGKEISVGAAGIDITNGGDSLGAILSDLINANIAETHTSAAPGSPTTPPLNVATYAALIPRIEALLT